MNVHESEKIAAVLQNKNYVFEKDLQGCDVIVFNTCCIRQNAENRAHGNIGALKKLKKNNPSVIIAVGGCMTQQNGAAEALLKKFPYVDIIFGTHNLESFDKLLEQKINFKKAITEILQSRENINHNVQAYRTSYPNAYINIMYGCNNFCSYCIVPYVRGREISRNFNAVLDEFKQLIAKGYKEITLLGQNVNSYGNDLAYVDDGAPGSSRPTASNFAKLISECAKTEGKFRLRFMTNHPKDLSADMVKAMSESENICKSIHLPLQSGSDKILSLMNRKYTSADYLKKLEMIRNIMPECTVSTDIMVGFPSETEKDFEDTLSLVKTANFSSAFTFIYSPRSGTKAFDMQEQIDEETKKDRVQRLIKIQNEITKKQSKEYIGKTALVLCEDFDGKKNCYMGRDFANRMIYFPSETNVIGEFINVKVQRTGGISLFGSKIE